ncbi:apolipoprotein D-like [Pomacea canaliculata]|uniref:apolipoprotein D-like n=1 Tax=Pomacea canaliculata TaxID=400727 RepID=UPI000D73BFF9|nr:apolipoprotein D-like [Pomacea canaliculata]
MGPQLIIFACLLAVTAAQVTGFGACPPVVSQSKLNASQYLGDWYEIFVFPNTFEAGKCIRARYSLKDNGRIRVFNRQIENGVEKQAIGEAFISDPSKPAQLSVRFTESSPYAPYWVVDTDYKTYSLIYSCQSILGLARFEFAWILSRNMTLRASIADGLKGKLTAFGVDVRHFVQTDQSGCPP